MSESKHSPEPLEPWRADGQYMRIVDCDGSEVAESWLRERVIACVNACAGLPTEALESGALPLVLQYAANCAAGDEWANEPNPEVTAALRALGRLP